MRILLAQYFTNNLSYGKFSKAINERYCAKHGYEYHLESDSDKIRIGSDDRDFTWYKPKFLVDIFKTKNPDYILFLDADAVVINEEIKVEDFIHENINILAAQDHGNCKLNAGVILLKNTTWTTDFLINLWNMGDEFPQYKRGIWHEQTCFGLLMDRIDNVSNYIKIIDNSVLNCRYIDDDKCFIFHAFGYANTKNRSIDQIYYKKFNIEPPIQIGESLQSIADKCTTDKSYFHNYISKVYEELFMEVRDKVKLFVEIGIGAGDSLWMWNKYFNGAKVIGVDIVPLSHMPKTAGCQCLIYDQSKDEHLIELGRAIDGADVIIDDGSHKMMDQQRTLAILFKHLKPGGIYVLEDLHTSLECLNPNKAVFNWGDPKKTTTLNFLNNYIKNKKFKSDYMSEDEILYLEQSIESVEVYQITENSITSVIRKKSTEPDVVYAKSKMVVDKETNLNNKIGVVYFVFCVGDWENIVAEQINKLVDSGLYDSADILWLVVSDINGNESKVRSIVDKYNRFNLEYLTVNTAELSGIKKVYDLCRLNPELKVLYFHAKGVSNTYTDLDTKERCERKIKGSRSWRNCMEHFLLTGWKDCVEKLNYYDLVVTTFTDGWVWGNFWWANSDYIRQHPEPESNTRWYYEYWVSLGSVQPSPKVYEYYHFTFLGLITYIPKFFYDGTLNKNEKIKLINAEYGALNIQLDEGYPVPPKNLNGKIIDVTDLAKKNLELNDYTKFDDRLGQSLDARPGGALHGSDPFPEGRKHLTINFEVVGEQVSMTFRGYDSQFNLHQVPPAVDTTPRPNRKPQLFSIPGGKKRVAFFTPMASTKRNSPIPNLYKKCITPFYRTAKKFFIQNEADVEVDFLFLTNSNEKCELDFVKTIKFDEEISDYSYGCLMKILSIEYIPNEYDYIFVADSDSIFANPIVSDDILKDPFVFLDHYYLPSLQSILETDTYLTIDADTTSEKWTMDTFFGGTNEIMRNFNKFVREQHNIHKGKRGPRSEFYSYYPGEFFILKYVFEKKIQHKRLSSCCEIGGSLDSLSGKMWHIGELPNNFDSKNGLGLEFVKHYKQLHQTKMKLDILDEITNYILGEPADLNKLKIN